VDEPVARPTMILNCKMNDVVDRTR